MATIVEIAQSDGRFGTLVQALQAADLVDTLNGDGPFTVFAPTDDAFEQLDNDVLNTLMGDKDKLTKVLTYHVADDRYTARDLEGLSRLTTLTGDDLQVSSETNLRVDEATIVQTDVEADNGIIQVIDQVILPEGILLS